MLIQDQYTRMQPGESEEGGTYSPWDAEFHFRSELAMTEGMDPNGLPAPLS